jgi:adenylate kinase family enzyme
MHVSRIAVVGVTGSGKTTLSQTLSQALALAHVELDALFWGPGWQAAEQDLFRSRVAEAVSGDRWVADGNYSQVRDLVWRRAQTVVWLDYPLPITLWRLTARTVWRIYTREELWNGNRESLRAFLFSPDSLYVWALRSYRRHRAAYPIVVTDYPHLQLVRLRSPDAAGRWMAGFRKGRAESVGAEASHTDTADGRGVTL